jgi:hypothetical protein
MGPEALPSCSKPRESQPLKVAGSELGSLYILEEFPDLRSEATTELSLIGVALEERVGMSKGDYLEVRMTWWVTPRCIELPAEYEALSYFLQVGSVGEVESGGPYRPQTYKETEVGSLG